MPRISLGAGYRRFEFRQYCGVYFESEHQPFDGKVVKQIDDFITVKS